MIEKLKVNKKSINTFKTIFPRKMKKSVKLVK